MNKFKFKYQLYKDSFIFTKERKSITRNVISIAICIILSIVIALIVATALGNNPFTILSDLFTKGFLDYKTLIWNIAILGIGGLSFSFAFKAGVFNIGIPGQMLGSGLMVLVISKAISDTGVVLPSGLGPIISILVAVFFGVLISTIVSLLKVFLNVNDVVSSILLNWIIFFIVRLVVFKFYNPDPNSLFSQSIDIPAQFQLVIPGLGGWLPTIIIFLVLVVLVFVIFKYTVFGHKISAVGLNPYASMYSGYNVKLIKILTMAISGGIAGLMAVVLYTTSNTPAIPLTYDYDALPNEGFNAIAIGLIALNNPIAIIPIAFIMGLIISSSPFLSISPSFSQVIMGLIVLGSAMFTILIKYKPWIYIKKHFYGSESIPVYNNYENEMEMLISRYKLKLSEIENKEEQKTLLESYLNDKKTIKSLYLKQLFILRSKLVFNISNELSLQLKSKNQAIDFEFLKYDNSLTKKKNKLLLKVNNNFNSLVLRHKKLFTKYNLLIDFKLKQYKKLEYNSLLNLIIFLYGASKQKYELFKKQADASIKLLANFENVKSNFQEFIKDLNLKFKRNQINFYSKLIGLQIRKKSEFDRLVRTQLVYLSWYEKQLLYKAYFNYLKTSNQNHDEKITRTDLITNLDDCEKLTYLSDKTIAKITTDFNLYYKKLIAKTNSSINKLQKWTGLMDKKIVLAKKQITVRKSNYEKLLKKYFSFKNKATGSLDYKYKNLQKVLNKKDLLPTDKQELQTWLSTCWETVKLGQGEVK